MKLFFLMATFFLLENINGVSFTADNLMDTILGNKLNFCHWPPPDTLFKIKLEFRVYLRDGRFANFTIETENEVNVSITALDRSNFFRLGRPVVFVIHGFREGIEAGFMTDIKNSLLALGDFTVFLVGWPRGSFVSFWNYAQAASNTQTVSTVLAMLTKAVLNLDTFNGNKTFFYLYCIGRSLGAHICGQAGKAVGLFDRITGLDPAGPGFAACPSNPSLVPQSADCVDAIHTDGNSSGHSGLIPHPGSLKRSGFVDFYPNGGVNQPGCNIFSNDFQECSHYRAVELFVYSLRKPKGVCVSRGPCREIEPLPDQSCDEGGVQQPMGYYSTCHVDVNPSDRKGGVFYLDAGARDPYC